MRMPLVRGALLTWLIGTSAFAAESGAAIPSRLTLADALRLMVEVQPKLVVSRQQVAAADSNIAAARAPWLPQISLALGYTRQTGNFAASPGAVPSTVTSTAGFNANTYDFLSAQLQVQQLIWDFGQTLRAIDAARASALAARQDDRTAYVTAALGVRVAYAAAAGQRDLLEVAKATFENVGAHQRQVEGFVRVGSRPEIDLAQSRADLAKAKLALVQAKNSYAVAKAKLIQAIGLTSTNDYEVVDNATEPLPEEQLALEQVLVAAEKSRPELASLEAQLEAQRRTLDSAWDRYWPTLSAQASGNVRGRSFTSLVPNFAVGATLNWNLWQGGAVEAAVAQNRARLAVLTAQRDITRLQVRLDAQQALLNITAGLEAIESAREEHESTQVQYRLAEARYTAGAGSMLEWMDARLAVTTAASHVVTAQFDLANARAQLQAALGR